MDVCLIFFTVIILITDRYVIMLAFAEWRNVTTVSTYSSKWRVPLIIFKSLQLSVVHLLDPAWPRYMCKVGLPSSGASTVYCTACCYAIIHNIEYIVDNSVAVCSRDRLGINKVNFKLHKSLIITNYSQRFTKHRESNVRLEERNKLHVRRQLNIEDHEVWL